MFPKLTPLVVLAALISGCPSPGPGEPTPSPTESPQEITQSLRSNVKFKRAQRIQNEFARVLGLSETEVCNELGLYSCTEFVHKVALGGVSPYDLGINEPPAATGATAPIVVDRVALSACVRRVDGDLTGGDTELFHTLPISSGALTDVNDPAVVAVLSELYDRTFFRAPTDDELQTLQAFYDTVAATSSQPARDWAVLSCFSVLTTMESLFY